MALCIMIAGGGTGGHIMPAIAVAEEVATLYKDARVWYVGRRGSLEERLVKNTALHFSSIHAAPLKKNIRALISCLYNTLRGLYDSWRLIRSFQPACIVGFGGYASFPLLLAGLIMKKPVIVHEANAVPGKAVRLLVRLGAFLAYGIDAGHPALKEVITRAAQKNKVTFTGNPVRRSICNAKPEEGYECTHLAPENPILLVTGGSQGAHALNEVMCEAAEEIARRTPSLQIIHITGYDDEDRVKDAYEEQGILHYVTSFSHNMGALNAAATVALSRAGALTIAELSAQGTPAVFVPYPFAADDHQYWNAQSTVAAGGGICIREEELSASSITDILCTLIEQPERCAEMACAAQNENHKDARKKVCDIIVSLCEGKNE